VVVSEKRQWKRIGAALALGAGLAVFGLVTPAVASPIYPNIRKVVSESEAAPAQFAPARAGWDGPEMARDTAHTDLDSAAVLRGNKAALLTAAFPDPRAIFAVILVIILMRMLRRIQEQQRQRLATVTPIDAPADVPEESRAA
jgi:hypothetical protein